METVPGPCTGSDPWFDQNLYFCNTLVGFGPDESTLRGATGCKQSLLIAHPGQFLHIPMSPRVRVLFCD